MGVHPVRCRTSRSSGSHALPWPKFGMTGPPATSSVHRSRSSRVDRADDGVPSSSVDGERVARARRSAARARRAASSSPGSARPGVGCRAELELAERAQRERLQRAVGADELARRTRRRAARGSRRGVSYCASTPPSRRIAMRSPILIASSMSCVTKTTVFRTSCCRRQELVLQARAHDRVDRAERLVHQHQRRVGGERAREADALALRRPRAAPGSASRTPGRARRARAARPTRVADARPSASRAAAARWRCSPRSSCAGRGRPAG